MTTSFELLHRNVQRKLWDMAWTELRSIQDQAIRHLLLGGGDAVIASPTASGKTEAAFLPVLSAIAETPGGSVRAMYVGPLKALINDQFRRVEDLCGRLEMPVCKWHGDVNDSAKQRLLASPSGILLITPESLEAMLVRRATTMPRLFSKLAFVVIDEMHAFIGTERGAQLLSQLHRLTSRTGCDHIRVGLSATLGDPETALRWLRRGGPPATLIHDASAQSSVQIKVRGMWRPVPNAKPAEGKENEPDPVDLELARAILGASGGKTNLVFANAKARIELVADALAAEAMRMKLPDEIVVHHGSLSRDRRLYAEERLRAARSCTAVCSNTLELGIDIGGIDEVLQVSAPWSVASLVQRVGRSGRREGSARVLRGFFVEQIPAEDSDVWDRLHLDFIQGLSTIELMLEKFVEPPMLGRAHLSTVIHQTLALLAETGGATAGALFKKLCGCGAFGDLSEDDFRAILHELGRRDLIEQMGDRTLIVGLAGQKIVEHYTFFAAFNAPEELRVVCGSDEIGTIAEPPAPGEHLVLAGRRWRVESIDAGRREVVVNAARGARAPKFSPSRGAVHRAVHAKMRALLVGLKKPVYLDSVASDILEQARAEAVAQRLFEPIAQPSGAGVRLFVFGGSRVQQTLSLVLSKAGLDAEDKSVGFDIDAPADQVSRTLRDFASNPDVEALALYADRVQMRREFGKEKFEFAVDPGVWLRSFAREELDAGPAASMALALSDALVSKPPVIMQVPRAVTLVPQTPRISTTPKLLPAAPRDGHSVLPVALENLESLCDAIRDLPTTPLLPERTVLIPNEAFAHAIRRELVQGERGALLLGTRFISPLQLSRDILAAADIHFDSGEERARPARLRALFRSGLPLRYFKLEQLRETPGWDEAIARTIGELESVALTPTILLAAAEDGRVRDVADLWAALDEAAGSSWTRGRIVREAASALSAHPALVPYRGPLLVAMTGHEPRVDAELVRALPDASLATWAARPRRTRHHERLSALLGEAVADVWYASQPPSSAVRELDLLKAFLLEDPARLALDDRPRSEGRDGSVAIEVHESVDAEIEAALTWVQQEISENGTPLEQIAIVVPSLDPVGAMLADRISDLSVPVHLLGGRSVETTATFARLRALLRALTTFLHRDALIELLPSIRVAREARTHLTRGEALEALGSLAIIGGTRLRPEGGLEWSSRIAERIAHIEKASSGARSGTERVDETRDLQRGSALLRMILPAIDALATVGARFVRGAPIAELWPAVESFVEKHLLVPPDGAPLLELFRSTMRELCDEPVMAAVYGSDAHHLLTETLHGLRLVAGRFGEPAITVASIEHIAGIPFAAVRILGMAEGLFPSSPREDPVLPDKYRRPLRGHGLRDRGDRMLAQLHALDRLVRNTRSTIVLSCPKRDLAGTYREISSVGIEVAIALARGTERFPDGNEIWRTIFRPAQMVLEAARSAAPMREATWQLRAARMRELAPAWGARSHLDLTRGRGLLDPLRTADAMDGLFPAVGWMPIAPGMSPHRPLSASRWRTFLECPHRSLFESLLEFRPPSAPFDDAGLGPLTYGALFHTVAERFYVAHGSDFIQRSEPFASFVAKAEAIATEAFDECLQTHALPGRAVRTAQRERLRRDVLALLEGDWEVLRERVHSVERGFGTDTPLAISVGGGHVHIHGYIDRIDIEGGAAVLRDLKTGKPKLKKEGEPDAATDAQLALYAVVARALSQEWGLPSRMAAAYVYPEAIRQKERAFQGAEYELLEKSAGDWLEMTTELAMARRFPRTPRVKDCTFCAFKPVCGPDAHVRAAHVIEANATALSAFQETKVK